MSLFKHQYRIESARLQNWDYRWNAAYFITICTLNKEHFFGEIVPVKSLRRTGAAHPEGDVAVQRLYVNPNVGEEYKMKLSGIGEIAWDCWIKIPTHFPFTILDAFTVMPNHIHGILIINNSVVETLHRNVSNAQPSSPDEQCNESDSRQSIIAKSDIPTRSADKSNQETRVKNEVMAAMSPKKGSLSAIMRSYKSAVTKQAHFINPGFGWQERFHDHIIRTEEEFKKIQNYIITNAQNWKEDMLNS